MTAKIEGCILSSCVLFQRNTHLKYFSLIRYSFCYQFNKFENRKYFILFYLYFIYCWSSFNPISAIIINIFRGMFSYTSNLFVYVYLL